jgi:hypothetical protein
VTKPNSVANNSHSQEIQEGSDYSAPVKQKLDSMLGKLDRMESRLEQFSGVLVQHLLSTSADPKIIKACQEYQRDLAALKAGEPANAPAPTFFK